jgi:hypothetical protein
MPQEILDQIFADTDYGDRWCFALSCKDAARYSISDKKFLAVPMAISLPIYSHPIPNQSVLWANAKLRDMVSLSGTRAYREVMRSLSSGWIRKDLHWCDQCRRFRSFPARMREEWYGDKAQEMTTESMRKGGGWVQDIGLSIDGLICWSHSCPPCAQRWWKSLPSKVRQA